MDFQKKGIGIKVLAGTGAQIGTATPNGRLCFGIFASLAEFERDRITERAKVGLEAARVRGKMGECPRKMDEANLKMVLTAMSDRNSVVQDVAKIRDYHDNTLYVCQWRWFS